MAKNDRKAKGARPRTLCADFIREMWQLFPELRTALLRDGRSSRKPMKTPDEECLPEQMGAYLEAASLARLVNRSLRQGHTHIAKTGLHLVEKYLALDHDKLLGSALDCDFLEVLDLRLPGGHELFDAGTQAFKTRYIAAQNYIGKDFGP